MLALSKRRLFIMKINPIGPTFRGEGDVKIRYNDGANAKNPYINNIVIDVMNNLRKKHISASAVFDMHEISITNPPKAMIKELLKTDLICRIQKGNKLKLIV